MSLPEPPPGGHFDIEECRKTNPKLAACIDNEKREIEEMALAYDHDNMDHYLDLVPWARGCAGRAHEKYELQRALRKHEKKELKKKRKGEQKCTR